MVVHCLIKADQVFYGGAPNIYASFQLSLFAHYFTVRHCKFTVAQLYYMVGENYGGRTVKYTVAHRYFRGNNNNVPN